jgi:hypothetical protein
VSAQGQTCSLCFSNASDIVYFFVTCLWLCHGSLTDRQSSARISVTLSFSCEPGSSVSIVSDYGLDDRGIEVRSPAEAKDFSCSLSVVIPALGHPASCTMCTAGPFLGAKARPRRDADHSPPCSGEVENE